MEGPCSPAWIWPLVHRLYALVEDLACGGGLILIAPTSLAQMVKLGLLDANEQRQLAEPYTSSKGSGSAWLLYSKHRDGEPLFVIVAQDATSARHAIEHLATLNSQPRSLIVSPRVASAHP